MSVFRRRRNHYYGLKKAFNGAAYYTDDALTDEYCCDDALTDFYIAEDF